jgi:ABC-type phosphate/phosphonate transport system permease subunit
MGLFHMRETGALLAVTLMLVALVDLFSSFARRCLNG